MCSKYKEIEKKLSDQFDKVDENAFYCTKKVLSAMQDEKLSDRHFSWQTGYGYDDAGREILEAIYARVFSAEDALVRTQIVSGTHAISLGLRAVLEKGDKIFCPSGLPYETILNTIGLTGNSKLSLKKQGIHFDYIDLINGNEFDFELIKQKINSSYKMIYIQRSGGYSFRRAISIKEIEKLIKFIKVYFPDILVMVDNCYCEFVESKEPSDVGADLVAGSLIKNPGGGLALSGGYLVGKTVLINRCAEFLTAPGLGKDLGLSFGCGRSLLQGFFLAPNVVSSALKSAMFAAKLFESSGYKVCPLPYDERSDIIQSIELTSAEKLLAFCKEIQKNSPVDSNVVPVPSDMPGYESDIVMAAGTFIQGASIELSADAPIKEPYSVYLQGALTYHHAKIAIISAYESLLKM